MFPMKFEVSQQQGISREKECAENGFTRTISFPSCDLKIFIFMLQERFYQFVGFHPQYDFVHKPLLTPKTWKTNNKKVRFQSEYSMSIEHLISDYFRSSAMQVVVIAESGKG